METQVQKQTVNESLDELYERVHNKCYKTLRHIAMEIKIADEVIKEVGVRPNNIIGQQTAAATAIIRSHKLRDSSKIKSAAERMIEISKKEDQAKTG
jgi:predicted metal-dependent hydrolase